MNKLVIFDLDGVLVDTKDIHYHALNYALNKAGVKTIAYSEHVSTYDGLPTKTKLDMLSAKGLDRSLIPQIIKDKNEMTNHKLYNLQKDEKLVDLFAALKIRGYKIAVASNAVRDTVKICIDRLGLNLLVDLFLSNEDVTNQKPHPEIYWKAMSKLKALPENTIIVEDSAVGREGANKTGALVWGLDHLYELTLDNMLNYIDKLEKTPNKTVWKDEKMTVLIPMAGLGSRFAQAGYTFPKPLIEVRNKPMIQIVAENLGIEAKFVYIVQKEHYEKYNLKNVLNLITPNCEIVQTEGLTEGAACTTLLAKHLIDNDRRLVIANSDQFVEWDSAKTLYSLIESKVDGGILTFKSTHPKWSFAKVDESGFVTEVAEKQPISDNATVGIYYWKHGSDYVKYAEQMIAKNIRVNNEFYVCPVFNQAIADGKKIVTRQVEAMWGIGTPEDLNYFLNNYKGVV